VVNIEFFVLQHVI